MLEDKKVQGLRRRSRTSEVDGGAERKSDSKRDLDAVTPQRVSLQLECCAPCPTQGPQTRPLLGGLPGGPLLIGPQAASLRLAQLKAQLALTQISNSLAAGGRVAALSANSKKLPTYVPTTAPSPTAAAINLLNLLKIANTMSHPVYNPYASGNSGSAQGQYGPSGAQGQYGPSGAQGQYGPSGAQGQYGPSGTQGQYGPSGAQGQYGPSGTQGQYGPSGAQAQRDPRMAPHLRSESSFRPSGASSATPASAGSIPSLLSLPVNYKPERSRTAADEEMERSIDMQISRAREEAAMRQPVGMNPRFTGTPRDDYHPASTSYQMSPGPQGQRHSDVESSSGPLDWLLNYNRASGDNVSTFCPVAAPSSYPSSGDSRFSASTSGERQCDTKSFPGSGKYEYSAGEKPPVPAESSRPKYNSESAANILLHFGLEKEDLEHLIAYPEDQITPENLPFILRQIRIQKTKRTAAAVQPKSYSESQPTASASEMDRPSHSGGAAMHKDERASSRLQPSKVIDYGHTGKYTGVVGDDVGRTGGNSAKSGGSASMLPMDTGNRDREPFQQSTTGMDFSAMVSPRDQGRSAAPLGSSYSLGRSAVAIPSADVSKHMQPQPNQSSQSILTTFSLPSKDTDSRPLASEFSKPPSLKPLDPKLPSKAQSRPAVCNMPPGQRGMVLFDSRKDQSKTVPARVPEQTMKQPEPEKGRNLNQRQPAEKPVQNHPMQNRPVQNQLMQNHPVQNQPVQNQPALQAPDFSSLKPVPPPPFVPHVPNTPRPLLLPTMVAKPRVVGVSGPAQPQIHPAAAIVIPVRQTPSTGQRASHEMKGLPGPELLQDYAAATPRKFPHTCSLCNKGCSRMKDWISHQNTALHLENCRHLRTRYPEWDGDIVKLSSTPRIDDKPSHSTSCQPRHQQAKRQSRSRSRSRSYSPRRRQYHHGGSPDRRGWPRRDSRSRSRSPGRRGSAGQRDRWNSRSRSPSPRRHRGPDNWRDRSDSRSRSPQSRRSHSPRWPSGTYRRSHEQRSSSERSHPHRKRSNSAEKLAKKLLATSVGQSLSSQTDIATVIKTLTPALLAELTKRKSSPSTSASPSPRSGSAKKDAAAKSSKAKPAAQKVAAKSPPSLQVCLCNITQNLSYTDLQVALRQFGPIDSLVLYRSALQAYVTFKKAEDTAKLKSAQKFTIKDTTVSVKKATISKPPPPGFASAKLQRKPLSKKTEKAGVSNKPTQLKKAAAGAKTKVLASKAAQLKKGLTQSEPKTSKNPVKPSLKKTNAGAKKTEAAVEKTASAPKAETPSTKDEPKAPAGASVEGQATVPPKSETPEETSTKATPKSADEAKRDASKPGTGDAVSTAETPEAQVGGVADGEAKIPPKCETPEQQPGDVTAVKVEESAEAAAEVPDLQSEAELSKDDGGGGGIEPMELGELGVSESVKAEVPVESLTDAKDSTDESAVSRARPTAVAAPQELPDPPQTLKAEAEDSPPTEDSGTPGPESATPEPETPENVQTQPKDPVTAVQTRTATDEPQPSGGAAPPTAIREAIGKSLKVGRINFVAKHVVMSPRFLSQDNKVIFVTQLPKYSDGCYSEDDLARLFTPSGFQYRDDRIFIAPQNRMAFVRMPTTEAAQNAIKAAAKKDLFLSKSKLCLKVLEADFTSPLEFYQRLVAWMDMTPAADGSETVYIENIAAGQARDLVQVLTRIGSVTNYSPLLNKVFVHFDSAEDADRLGVWYSVLRGRSHHRVHRLLTPRSQNTARPPRLPANATPDGEDLMPGAAVLAATLVPEGSAAPFWLMLTAPPFLFPTASPWFMIPAFQTIRQEADIEKVDRRDSGVYTVMITGLPEENYRHRDVARLAWPHLPRQTLHSLHYDVAALPLQRRAFVHFRSRAACRHFLQAQLANPPALNGCSLAVHAVLQDMDPGSSEEDAFRSLMKWSNARVPEPDALEDRLLAVEISEVTLEVIRTVLLEVAAVAPVASFLPLADRICVEMASPAGAARVLKEASSLGKSSTATQTWSKVRRLESAKSLKNRLQDSGEDPVTFEGQAEAPAESDAATDAVPAQQKRDGELLNLDESVYRAIAAAVQQHRLSRQGSERSGRNEGPKRRKGQKGAGRRFAPEKFTFDHLNFNFEDFVTVDEIGADADDAAKDEESSAPLLPPSSSSSSQTKAKTSASPRKRKDSPEPTRSPAKSPVGASRGAAATTETESGGETSQMPQVQEEDTPTEGGVAKDEGDGEEPENYQILDSIDDEPEEEADRDDGSSEVQTREPDPERSAADGGFQVLDSVGDEGPTGPEDNADGKGGEDQEATSPPNPQPDGGEGSTAKQPTEEDASHMVARTDMSDSAPDPGGETDRRGDGDVSASVSEEQPSHDRDAPDLQKGGASCEGDVKAIKDEEEEDSVDRHPTSSETDSKRRRTRRQDVTVKKEDVVTRRSSRRTGTSDGEDREMKRDAAAAKRHETLTKDNAEDNVDQVGQAFPDTAETERRTSRGSGEKTDNRTEAAENKDAAGDQDRVATRSTRGRRGPTPKTESSDETPPPTRRKRKTPTETRDEASHQILDSVEEDRPAAAGRRAKRGRLRRSVRTATKEQEEEEAYQVVDSVDEDTPTDEPQSAKRSSFSRTANAEEEDKLTFRIEGEELQTLVSLDEIVKEEDDDREAWLSWLESRPLGPESQSAKPPPSSETVDEAGEEEEQEEEAPPTRRRSRRKSLVGRDTKRLRSQAPGVTGDHRLPPFQSGKPLGLEFVVPKLAFFCQICSTFYLSESAVMNVHCSSKRHYDNLQKHHQKLEEDLQTSAPSGDTSVSD